MWCSWRPNDPQNTGFHGRADPYEARNARMIAGQWPWQWYRKWGMVQRIFHTIRQLTTRNTLNVVLWISNDFSFKRLDAVILVMRPWNYRKQCWNFRQYDSTNVWRVIDNKKKKKKEKNATRRIRNETHAGHAGHAARSNSVVEKCFSGAARRGVHEILSSQSRRKFEGMRRSTAQHVGRSSFRVRTALCAFVRITRSGPSELD